jgi:hypothetical protein
LDEILRRRKNEQVVMRSAENSKYSEKFSVDTVEEWQC